MEVTTVLIAEHKGREISPVTYELAGFARELQPLEPGWIKAIVLGDDVSESAKEIAARTGLDVLAVQVPALSSYNGEVYKGVLGRLLPELKPRYVCVGGTTQGMDFAPGLAVRLGASCITNVESVRRDESGICFSRSMFGGKIVTDIRPETELAVLTLQPGSVKPPALENLTPGSVELRTVDYRERQCHSVAIERRETHDATLTEAAVIVSAGRGIGKKENLELIQRFAALFPKSAVGGSRPVCDVGWLELRRQVGQTGATVNPDLYIACGISGTAQHIAGMRGSKFIVAINHDPDAAIFNVADVCIVEDLTTFIPTLIDEWNSR